MSKHFAIERTTIAVHDTAPRGVTVVASQSPTCLHLYLHNGCGRGNMKAILTNEEAIKIAIELIKVATR